jgi:hypothetical protein
MKDDDLVPILIAGAIGVGVYYFSSPGVPAIVPAVASASVAPASAAAPLATIGPVSPLNSAQQQSAINLLAVQGVTLSSSQLAQLASGVPLGLVMTSAQLAQFQAAPSASVSSLGAPPLAPGLTGLGDTYCTDDQLDTLATCPAGYVPDYTSTCSCLPGPTVSSTTAAVTSVVSTLPNLAALLVAGLAAFLFLGGKK